MNDLVAFGATVHTCSRTESELNKCLQEWQSQGFSVTGSVCDVSSRPQRESLIQQVASTFNGKLNIFVSTHCDKPLICLVSTLFKVGFNSTMRAICKWCLCDDTNLHHKLMNHTYLHLFML